MPYSTPHARLTGVLLRALSCPYLFGDCRCGGGDYCAFPPGREQLCCFFCPRFDSCPDRTGVCSRLEE